MMRGKVVIVEDETIVALDIESALESFGYRVVAIVETKEGLIECAKKQAPDLAIMDIDLGQEYSGIDLADILKNQFNISSLFLSAFSDESTTNEAIKINPYGYLIKPFNREQLKITADLAIHKIRLERESEEVFLPCGYIYNKRLEVIAKENKVAKLSKNEKKLLKLLCSSTDYVVPFATIENEIYYDNPVTGSAIKTLLYRLRIKLDCDIIERVKGVGLKVNTSSSSPSSL